MAVLYDGWTLFLCRHCYDITYASRNEGRIDRLTRRARKIRRKLGASDSLDVPIWRKPKGMHQTTFDRMRREAEACEEAAFGLMYLRLGEHVL